MTLSVLLSVYAKENPDYLQQCLASFTQQIHSADEIVLVEDGPLSAELEVVIASFITKLPLKQVKLTVNSGLAVALNIGLAECSGDYVARMDTDDVLLPGRFAVQLKFMQQFPEIDLVGCFATEINEIGNKGRLRTMPTEHDDIVNSLWSNPFIHPAVMFKRQKMLDIGGYDTKLRRRQDYELWFRCAKNDFRFANIPQALILYRFLPGTHKKQTVTLAWEQAMIGFKGASSLKMPLWKRLACFIPFIRSLLPTALQHRLYSALKRFDPRQQRHNTK
ncbi:glycosyltransferase [Chromatiaceae bacterium AAb-1]|nr:glycosyltransferase [Chromatiaceae bacterium AAb-1]